MHLLCCDVTGNRACGEKVQLEIPRGKLLVKVPTPSLMCLEALLNKVVILFWVLFLLLKQLPWVLRTPFVFNFFLIKQNLTSSMKRHTEAVIRIMWLCTLAAGNREVLFNSQFTC